MVFVCARDDNSAACFEPEDNERCFLVQWERRMGPPFCFGNFAVAEFARTVVFRVRAGDIGMEALTYTAMRRREAADKEVLSLRSAGRSGIATGCTT